MGRWFYFFILFKLRRCLYILYVICYNGRSSTSLGAIGNAYTDIIDKLLACECRKLNFNQKLEISVAKNVQFHTTKKGAKNIVSRTLKLNQRLQKLIFSCLSSGYLKSVFASRFSACISTAVILWFS